MNLKIISAGAGSGKTYRLTSEMVSLLASGDVRASGIIATTFTRKAAAELQERVRIRLLEEGLSREANDLSNALIGTVHGLGVKLLRRFSYEAGVSPEVDIIADEDQQVMFNQSLATVLTNDRVVEMEDLANRLGFSKSSRYATDWRNLLKQLTEVVRANNFSKEKLDQSKRRSFESFCTFLDPPVDRSAEGWNARLAEELETAVNRLENNEDNTRVTADAVNTLRGIATELKFREELYWHQWVKISKLKVGARSRDDVEDLRTFADSHLSHTGFRDDLRTFLYGMFDTAQMAIEEYGRYKKSRGLIDYTDMEVLVNELLNIPVVQEVMAQELDLLMVDEFQDTSPLQLEIFLKLSKYARHAVWVGDPKQSIYGFRGAEPALMQAIVDKQGGLKPENILSYSWRSREDIVHTTNAIFTSAFTEMPAEQVVLEPKRRDLASGASFTGSDKPESLGAALRHWHFEYDGDGRRPGRSWYFNCLADALRIFLDRKPLIQPKGSGACRIVQPGDVAILCRSNRECLELANALHGAGLKAAISRAGLLSTAEARLLLACMKYMLNQQDSLSVAEIMLLASRLELKEIIEDRLDYLDGNEITANNRQWGANDDCIHRLDQLRQQVVELSSAEILTLLLEELDLRRIIVAWGNVEQRLSNVDVFIKLSLQYEEACNRLHTAASLGGFLLWLNDLEGKEADLQGPGKDQDAVNLLTYHKSKGLEFHVVICASLENQLREDVWGLSIIPEQDEVDLDNLLGNRWLRFWINPYADQFRNTLLADRIDDSPAKADKRREALAEEARLLYVGITRARDYLIFPSYHRTPVWLNRVCNNGDENIPALDTQSDQTLWEWNGTPMIMKTEVFSYPNDFPQNPVVRKDYFMIDQPPGRHAHRPYVFDPAEERHNVSFMLHPISYRSAVELPEVPERHQVGVALKHFMIADAEGRTQEERKAMAGQLLTRGDVSGLVEPEVFTDVADEYYKWMKNEYGIFENYRHFSIRSHFRGQLYETSLDHLLRTSSGWVVVLHSAGIGNEKARNRLAGDLSLELWSQKKAVKNAFDSAEIDTWIHFLLYGTLVKVEFQQEIVQAKLAL